MKKTTLSKSAQFKLTGYTSQCEKLQRLLLTYKEHYMIII